MSMCLIVRGSQDYLSIYKLVTSSIYRPTDSLLTHLHTNDFMEHCHRNRSIKSMKSSRSLIEWSLMEQLAVASR